MAKQEFYRHMGQYKLKDYGTLINEQLIYTKEDLYTIHHLPTGTRVASDKTLKKAKEKAFRLLEKNQDFIEERTRKFDLAALPSKEDMYTVERELEHVLNLKFLPYDGVVLAFKSQLVIDFIQLDQILAKRKGYDFNKSLNDNIVTMYGPRTLELMDHFKLAV